MWRRRPLMTADDIIRSQARLIVLELLLVQILKDSGQSAETLKVVRERLDSMEDGLLTRPIPDVEPLTFSRYAKEHLAYLRRLIA